MRRSRRGREVFLRAYPLQTHEMLFDAHDHAFRVLGGVPRRGIYDNMRTAVDKVGRGKERQVNARFSAMVSHFLFEAEFCNPASGWEKGQIEKNVQDARHRLWQPTPGFPSLAALTTGWRRVAGSFGRRLRTARILARSPTSGRKKRSTLMPLSRPFDGFVEYAKRVSPTCLIHLDRNRYSVPASFANRPVSVRVYPERIVVAAEGQIICEHRRVFARSHQRKVRPPFTTGGTIWRSCNASLEPSQWRAIHRTPARLPNSAAAHAQDARRRPRDGRDPGSRPPA